MGFSVKGYLPLIFSALSCFFFFVVYYRPGENNVQCLEGFSWKARSLLTLSTAPGKSVKKSSKELWQSPDIYRLRQSCAVFGNLLKLSGIVGKRLKTPWYTNQNNIGLLVAVFISFFAFWKKYYFSEILLLLVLKCAKFNWFSNIISGEPKDRMLLNTSVASQMVFLRFRSQFG